MTCEKYSEWLSLYIDMELENKEIISFEKHLNACESCQEEVEMLRGIINNIENLEIMDLPEGFHEQLMAKIKTEKQKQENTVIPLSLKQKKWYTKLKIVGAVAAVFIFSTILINPLKVNAPKESMFEAEGMSETRMMDESEEVRGASPEAGPQARGAVFSIEPMLVEENMETWLINTENYNEDKEAIARAAEELGLGIMILEELGSAELGTQSTTIEITLQQDQRSEFESKISDMEKTVSMEDQGQSKEEGSEIVNLLIMINQISQ